MPNLRRHFIEQNLDILRNYSAKEGNKWGGILGFGSGNASDWFKSLLIDKDDFYLPACLLHAFWEFTDTDDREFVLQSLSDLYTMDVKGNISDPDMAYVHAYCLCHTDSSQESFDIISQLADQCFPPALVTMGDGCIANQMAGDALDYYAHAMEHGHMFIIPRHNKIVLKNTSFIKNIPFRFLTVFDIIYRTIKIMKMGMKGPLLLYLDFYKIKYHLNEYWKIPKAERIRQLDEHLLN